MGVKLAGHRFDAFHACFSATGSTQLDGVGMASVPKL